eukprot:gnl/MRDRNA2_/MRDRNA2_91395_c0_seq1.p1 gnl/MRDRNA2_/MRDRNA2_91395_c0~~gnl/MRDRNA2_/MRDRNA2_91395_c0_seq1.p1  ORF type:complete len:781 (-),score=233.75 gnl/MRDRNA2_/MRDRNA2_91395_c0_seq1:72-2414(-)
MRSNILVGAALMALAAAADGSSMMFGFGDGKSMKSGASALQMISESLERAGGLTAKEDNDGRQALENIAVKRVIEILQDTQGKVTALFEREEKEMSDFSSFCDNEVLQRTKAVEASERKIAGLSAAIADATKHARATENEAASMSSAVAAKMRAMVDAAEKRAKGQSRFVSAQGQLVETGNDVNKSIELLRQGMSLSKAASLEEKKTVAMALSATLTKIVRSPWSARTTSRGVLQSFLKAAHGQRGHGVSPHNVMASLVSLQRTCQTNLKMVKAAETRAAVGFDTMARDLADAKATREKKLAGVQALGTALAHELSRAKQELAKAQMAKKGDEAFLSSLRQECSAAEDAWAVRKKAHTEETATVDKARKTLRQRSFFQGLLSAKSPKADSGNDERTKLVRSKVAEHLKATGRKLSSFMMLELAGMAAVDSIQATRSHIQGLMVKLQGSARSDAAQEELCEENLAKSEGEKREDIAKVDELQGRMGKATAAKAALEASIGELEAELSAIGKGTAEAVRIREEQQKTSEEAIRDYSDAVASIEQAKEALKEYQAGTGVLLQVQDVGAAAAHGIRDSSVISILQTAGNEFRAMLKEVKVSEARAAAAHKKMMAESKAAKVTKYSQLKSSQAELKVVSGGLNQGAQSEVEALKALEAVAARLARLQPECQLEAQASAAKTAKRGAELTGLKQALKILDGPALLQGEVSVHRSLRASAVTVATAKKTSMVKSSSADDLDKEVAESLAGDTSGSGLNQLLNEAEQDGEAEADAEMQGLKDALSENN